MAYADDLLITTRTKQSLNEAFQRLKEQSIEYGLTINNDKTKYLRCKCGDNQPSDLQIGDALLQGVKSYKYLGSEVNGINSIENEVRERITLGNRAYFAHKTLFQSRLLSKNAKLKLYTTIIRPVVTYAAETWVFKVS